MVICGGNSVPPIEVGHRDAALEGLVGSRDAAWLITCVGRSATTYQEGPLLAPTWVACGYNVAKGSLFYSGSLGAGKVPGRQARGIQVAPPGTPGRFRGGHPPRTKPTPLAARCSPGRLALVAGNPRAISAPLPILRGGRPTGLPLPSLTRCEPRLPFPGHP